jgi:integrase
MFISNLTPRQREELQRLTVEQALAHWQKLYAIGRKPQTLHYHAEILATIRAHWPDLQTVVADVTDAQCVAFAERIGHFCPSRFNAMVNTLRNVIPQMACVPRRRYLAGNQRVPTPEEFERLLAALDVAQQGQAGLVIRLLAHTGLRINEARNLKWEHIRADHIALPGEITKNGKPRCVPYVDGAQEVLRELRKLPKYHAGRNAYVLPQARCNKALKYACQLVGLPRFSHHTFRHYFATRCIVSGVDIPTVAKMLGHSDNGALLLKTYCHLLDEHTVEMARRVKIGGLPVPASPAGNNEGRNIIPLFQPAPEPAAAPAVAVAAPVLAAQASA